MVEAKKMDISKIDWKDKATKIKEHSEDDHIAELQELFGDTFSSYKKSIGNKRKLNYDEAEALANKIYDGMSDYLLSTHYKMKPEAIKELKGVKGKHGDKALDTIVESIFKIDRRSLIKGFKEYSETGKSFSAAYIQKALEKPINNYHGHGQQQILGDIGEEHIDELKSQLGKYIDWHKLEKKDYNSVLKSKNFGNVLQHYVEMASQYSAPEEKKPDGK